MIFVTGNKGKFEEASRIINNLKQLDLDLIEIQSLNPKEIIAAKVIEAKKKIKEDFVVEDAGIYIKCLNGFPGPLGKWLFNAVGNSGVWEIVKKYDDRTATVKVVLGYVSQTGETHFFEGIIEGEIVEPRGDSGFGFDPIFLPSGHSKTFAEMTIEEKNSLSMRKIAFFELKKFVEDK